MENFLKYYINKEKSVVVEILKGSINLNDYLTLKKQQINDKEFNPTFNVIIDIRDLNINYSDQLQERMSQYLEFVKPIDSLSEEKKVAVITDTPDQVVYATINKTLDRREIEYNIFSTKAATLRWLDFSDNGFDMIREDI